MSYFPLVSPDGIEEFPVHPFLHRQDETRGRFFRLTEQSGFRPGQAGDFLFRIKETAADFQIRRGMHRHTYERRL